MSAAIALDLTASVQGGDFIPSLKIGAPKYFTDREPRDGALR
jgi:hypothetical protein